METTHHISQAVTDDSALAPANLLRWLGVTVFAAGAVAFLLQGLDSANELLRNWAYLILMAAVGFAGIGVQRLLNDAKSARVLLSLGVTLVSVQMAQLAGLIHDYTNGVEGVSLIALILGASATLLTAVPVSQMGFRVLARPQAGFLAWALLGLGMLLLLPWREGLVALTVLMTLVVGTIWVDYKIRHAGLLRTLEGTTARLLLILPALIGVARYGFYLQNSADHALFGLVVAGFLMIITQVYVRAGWVKEILFAIATCVGSVAFIAWSDGYLSVLPMLMMLSAAFMGVSLLSQFGWAYRAMSALIVFLAVQDLVFSGDTGQQVLVLTIGAGLMALGYLRRWRIPVVTGLLITGQVVFLLSEQVLVLVNISSWISLALGGVFLVILASVLERYGSNLLRRTAGVWHAFKAW